jgi:uncharacterized membrane protein
VGAEALPRPAHTWILIVVATLAWGLWGIFDKRALMGASPLVVLLVSAVLQGLMAVVYFVVLRVTETPLEISRESLLWTALSVVATTSATAAYLYALSQHEASYVLGVTAGYPVVMAIGAAVLLGEQITPLRGLGIALVSIGVYCISLE